MKMKVENHAHASISTIESELYFLIARFLSSGQCKKTWEVFQEELREHKLLPRRIDWEGEEHARSYENLVETYRHISQDYLLKVVQRVGPLLEKEIKPNISGVQSLLGAGSLSLLRTAECVHHPRWTSVTHGVLHNHQPLLPPRSLKPPNNAQLLSARELSGHARKESAFPSCMYSKYTQLCRKLGHLSAIYCVSFDRTGNFIFTGADDHLVKIWHAKNFRLLATLRGHSLEITDMAVNYENTLLASGSCDKTIRVWHLRSKSPVTVLSAHTNMITSLQFCPQARGETRYLMSTGGDGCVCFWHWNVNTLNFNQKPTKFIERSRAGAQMLCSSFSPGGMFLATGSTDHVIRVYYLSNVGPEKICELEAHSEHVDSISYSNRGSQFLSGGRDGTARIWRFERQEWRNVVLNMSTKLPKTITAADTETEKDVGKLKVTMVGWNIDDSLIVTAVNDFSLKVWDSLTGKLLHILKGHEDEVYVLENSPTDPRICLSAGHDGYIMLWDIHTGTKIKSFYNSIEGQGFGAVFDCKFSPDGFNFTATDSHGHVAMFGFGSSQKYKKVPEQLFFHTDYRPLIRDANNFVLDEQTQQPPHLMPPPFLVDIDGNPYPPTIQRLVPGRENCNDSSLVPQVAVNEDGDSEVIDGPMPNIDGDGDVIDVMIQRLQREQDERIQQDGGEPLQSPPPVGSPPTPARIGPGSLMNRFGMRRSGDVEGVRNSLGHVTQRATQSEISALSKIVVVKRLDPVLLRADEDIRNALSEREMRNFVSQRKKKPFLDDNESSDSGGYMKTRKHQKNHGYGTRGTRTENEETGRNRLTTRALYDTEEDEETEPNNWQSDAGAISDSSDYSDWMPDASSNLQPPTRTSQRKRKRKKFSSSEEEGQEVDVEEEDTASGSQETRKSPKKKTKPRKTRPYRKKKEIPQNVTELPEQFRPSEWLTDCVPRKAPYVPQMGDEVIYFRQGHYQYCLAVKKHKVFPIDPDKNQPWTKRPLRAQELVKVVGIKYEIRPPRLCCLKLAFLDPVNGKMTGDSFSIKYHDMPDVIDFLVLKKMYNLSKKRKWRPGVAFRSVIDDAWWTGKIISHEPFQEIFPDSLYQCYNVAWDNGEYEKLSPWDLEPIDERCLPDDPGGGVPVTPEEFKSLMYVPSKPEWPPHGRDQECERIARGLELIMEHSIAEPFLTPVDLNTFPVYAMIIEYPIDLTTIKSRLENGYYRRVTAIQFDVRFLESNTQRFNEPRSLIVRSAKILVKTILTCISDTSCVDPMPMLHKLSHGEEFRWKNTSSESEDSESGSEESHNNRKRKRNASDRSTKRQRLDPNAWKDECSELLRAMTDCQDSEPFRSPVREDDYPDYHSLITSPMDLCTIQEKLQSSKYSDPVLFIKDARLMFQNSKIYNTNKRSRAPSNQMSQNNICTLPVKKQENVFLPFSFPTSNFGEFQGLQTDGPAASDPNLKIYTMTLRLSAMFEEQAKDILSSWKMAKKMANSRTRNILQSPSSSSVASPSKYRSRSALSDPDYNQPSTSGYCNGSTSKAASTRSQGASRSLPNGATKSSQRPARRKGRLKIVRRIMSESEESDNGEKDKVKTKQADSSDDSSTEDVNDSEECHEKKTKPAGKPSRKAKKMKQKQPATRKTGRPAVNNGSIKHYTTRAATGSLKQRRYGYESSDDDDDDDDDDYNHPIVRTTSKSRIVRKRHTVTVKIPNKNESHSSNASPSKDSTSSSTTSSSSSSSSDTETESNGDKPSPPRQTSRTVKDSSSSSGSDTESASFSGPSVSKRPSRTAGKTSRATARRKEIAAAMSTVPGSVRRREGSRSVRRNFDDNYVYDMPKSTSRRMRARNTAVSYKEDTDNEQSDN